MNRALVAGAAGGIGRAVVDALTSAGYAVIGVDSEPPTATPGGPDREAGQRSSTGRLDD